MDFPAGLIATHYCEAMRGFPGFPNSQCILYLETKITGVRSQIAEPGGGGGAGGEGAGVYDIYSMCA